MHHLFFLLHQRKIPRHPSGRGGPVDGVPASKGILIGSVERTRMLDVVPPRPARESREPGLSGPVEETLLVVPVVGCVMLAGFLGVVRGVVEVAFRYVRMVSGLLMIARLMVVGGVLVMFGGVLVVLSGFAVVLRGILGHG
jgi:hypothetical protein